VRGATWLLVVAVFGTAVSGSGLAEAGGDDGDGPGAAPAIVGDSGKPHSVVRVGHDVRWDHVTANLVAGKRWSHTANLVAGKRWSHTANLVAGKRWSHTANLVAGKRWIEPG
jgi:hypothetical protein